MATQQFPLDRFVEARARISHTVHKTPLMGSKALSKWIGVPVYFKCENLQKTGSFKVRGALHKVTQLTQEERAKGVATISAGNHAQAVAWAATSVGVSSVVVMPENASPTKVAASKSYGAEVILHGDAKAAFAKVLEVSRDRGLTFLHPFDDEEVIAGHGSCALEIAEQLPEVRSVIVPVGGGGLSSGIAAAMAVLKTDISVWGVEPEGAPSMHRSLESGNPIQLDSTNTIADGLAPPMAGTINYNLLAAHASGVVLVTDDEIVYAMKTLLERMKLLVEPSGAAGLAALLANKIPLEANGPVVVILTGGNADLIQLCKLLSGS
ncbi:MAG: threonine/serine dehydratase [Gemmatimonadota bacterium]|uniref:Tryptophan synthase beta chain-like PALP domain-containing protein n=1 Tax=marine metagenome TaxID=408172 RepID=A0A381N8C8_9ZZZZ|nr:threonine/serine dehydratase [Gemmatimonadota bacterium]